jgi:signal peptidase II
MQLILWSALIIGSVILDQISKYLAVMHLKPMGECPLLPGILQLRYVENTGAAFGILKGQRWLFILLSTLLIAVLVYILIRYRNRISRLLGLSLAMIVGGGIGNQIDRLFVGYVVDFFEVLFVDFAVFNVADCFVTVGTALAILSLLLFDRALLTEDIPSPKDEGEKREDS